MARMGHWSNQVYQMLTIDYHMKKSKSWLPLYFLHPALLCTAQNCVVNTRKLSTIGPLVGGYGAPTLQCTSSFRNTTIYNIMRWFSLTKRLMFQVLFFFIISCKILCKNSFNLFSYLFLENYKNMKKKFECPKSIDN